MANLVYQAYKKNCLNAGINLGTSNINVMLVTSSYTPNGTADAFQSNVTNEVTGVGYVAGGTTLTGGTVTAAGGTAEYTANNVTWGTSTITARGAVLYQNLGTVASSNPLIGYFDFVTDQVSSSGDFTIAWNASGIVNLT